ncbi:MAG: hypothetical protein EZS28_050146, partial [Streblomastix strix]
NGMIEIISQIWGEVEREGEQFQVKVQVMDKTMMIGLKGYNAKFRDNNQDNSGFFATDENKSYLQFRQFQEHQPICQVFEQFMKKLFAQRTGSLQTSMKKVVFLGQVQSQLMKRETHQSRIFKLPDNYSWHKITKNNLINK